MQNYSNALIIQYIFIVQMKVLENCLYVQVYAPHATILFVIIVQELHIIEIIW